jgi:hypothetical protein
MLKPPRKRQLSRGNGLDQRFHQPRLGAILPRLMTQLTIISMTPAIYIGHIINYDSVFTTNRNLGDGLLLIEL